jgi:hypothetical protein
VPAWQVVPFCPIVTVQASIARNVGHDAAKGANKPAASAPDAACMLAQLHLAMRHMQLHPVVRPRMAMFFGSIVVHVMDLGVTGRCVEVISLTSALHSIVIAGAFHCISMGIGTC